ncbi:HesA/MoeB/ThiF family protein [Marinospirillum insulare]|uniref:Molybdopterin-synthase adenylyltransferase MoeB n=1 Tax=Marinospirillum insulare TaxID=217169 RepID=A0ABQ5ZXM0_9GAMM|nr:molybdopterin-synthase adenylyltransferase MoeB [Marinospirillum insulare]GLR64744.1 molybdopterin-synthase adenylyltransferase MoeB [Marinospirillum insulare]
MNDLQLLRYSRQILLPEVDIAGQERLINSKVLIVGLGGLGSPVALYLAAAGVGELHLADHDRVDVSNLQRQVVHQEASLDQLKVESAAQRLKQLNPAIKIVMHNHLLEGDAMLKAVEAVDLVCDCSDRFSTRFAINRASQAAKKPSVFGAAIRFSGQMSVFDPGLATSPCYACIYDENSDDAELSCSESGVLSPLVGVVGSLQAVEALKVLGGFGEPAIGKLLTYDGLRSEMRNLKLQKDPFCSCCSNHA